ncbi:hypothetical protein C4544_03305 [candidate division WS5 bacterium]|uniref:Uncharacterized protein n=1 Tax=candidate division WS5 bacterium TaxID=2093353 RepID=A0A419DDX5_9BACT|nr:MAG: hypothetical protein C4544_03305 [candidate division WS5 bacterium]
MSKETSITNINDKKIIQYINNASSRVVYMAPGLSKDIASVLATAWERLGKDAVTVILDVDSEVYRFGYGTVDGLHEIRLVASRLGTLVCSQPGVRIGLLIADDVTIIYTPTPLLIEAGSTSPEHPNAIQLESPPKEVTRDVGLGDNPHLERVVGLDPVKHHEIEKVEEDLKNNPPQKFDLARQVRVFTSRFQFVELEMTGCYISRKKVPIPSDLMGLANTKDVQSQLHAHFNLVKSAKLEVNVNNVSISEESLRKKKQRIMKDYLILLAGYGSVVLRSNKTNLEEDVDKLKKDIETYQKGIETELEQHINQNADTLINALFPAVKQNPPSAYTKFHGKNITDAQLRQFLEEDIKGAFGAADDLIKEMTVKLVYKDVAYESLVDSEFLKIAREAIPGIDFLHEEFNAASPVKNKETT